MIIMKLGLLVRTRHLCALFRLQSKHEFTRAQAGHGAGCRYISCHSILVILLNCHIHFMAFNYAEGENVLASKFKPYGDQGGSCVCYTSYYNA